MNETVPGRRQECCLINTKSITVYKSIRMSPVMSSRLKEISGLELKPLATEKSNAEAGGAFPH